MPLCVVFRYWLQCAVVAIPPDAPFTVAVATSTLEAEPVYLAVARGGSANFRFINGGVRSLLNGGAHAATNAETQMLLAIDANPKNLFRPEHRRRSAQVKP